MKTNSFAEVDDGGILINIEDSDKRNKRKTISAERQQILILFPFDFLALYKEQRTRCDHIHTTQRKEVNYSDILSDFFRYCIHSLVLFTFLETVFNSMKCVT